MQASAGGAREATGLHVTWPARDTCCQPGATLVSGILERAVYRCRSARSLGVILSGDEEKAGLCGKRQVSSATSQINPLPDARERQSQLPISRRGRGGRGARSCGRGQRQGVLSQPEAEAAERLVGWRGSGNTGPCQTVSCVLNVPGRRMLAKRVQNHLFRCCGQIQTFDSGQI